METKIPNHEKYLEIAQNCSFANLRKASRMLTQLMDDMLRPLGLHSTQFTVLVALAAAGEVTMTPLSRALAMDRTTLARNLEPLQRERLVEVNPGKDQRTRLIRLTPEGATLVAQAVPIWEEGQKAVIDHLGQDRWAALMGDLSSLVSMVNAEVED